MDNRYCEAWISGRWIVIPVLVVLNQSNELTARCFECHGPIVLMNTGRNNSTRAHFEHRPRHTGCSIGHYYDGTRTLSPTPVNSPVDSPNITLEGDISEESDEPSFPEGEQRYVMHKSYERNSELVKLAKARQLANTGALKCEVCEFDFFNAYGDIGCGFIEAHHKVPLSQLETTQNTRIDDLALVCSNCHRMLHRFNNLLTVDDLKKLLIQNMLELN